MDDDPFVRDRQLAVEVASKLSNADCEKLVFIYQLPENRFNGETAFLRVLNGLKEIGVISLTQPETLKKVVQSVKRNDLVKEIDKHIKDRAKQDKKRSAPGGGAATGSSSKKLLSEKDANLKIRFDHIIFQTDCSVKYVEELSAMLSAEEGSELYHKAGKILSEIKDKMEDLMSELKKARSVAKLGATAFESPGPIDDRIKDVAKIVCQSDPPRRKTYNQAELGDGVKRELQDVILSRGSPNGTKRPLIPKQPRIIIKTPSVDNQCTADTVNTSAPIRKHSVCGSQTNDAALAVQRLSGTSDYWTGSGSFGDANEFSKVPDESHLYEPLSMKERAESSDYATPIPRSSHPDVPSNSIIEGTRTHTAGDQMYENLDNNHIYAE